MNPFKVALVQTETEKARLFQLREEVFVVEQNVNPDEEFDEFEESSRHFLATDSEGNAIGAARWRTTEKGIKLERFAVKKSWRSKGVGSALVQEVLDDIQREKGSGHLLYLHAQLDAIPLYRKFGFEQYGDLFEECKILHYAMKKTN